MKNITKQAIIDYLLGKMPKEQQDDFLANCFSNDANVQKYELERENLVENYLRGRLSKEDEILFNDHFLKHPYHKELFEFSRSLRTQLKDNKELAIAATTVTGKKSFSFGSLLVPAAALGALILAGVIFFSNFINKNNGDDIAKVPPIPEISPIQTPILTPISSGTPIETPIVSPSTKPSNQSSVEPNSNIPIPKETEKPTQPLTNSIFAFSLPMGAKGGDNKPLILNDKIKTVELISPKPYSEYPKYKVIISSVSANKTIFQQEYKSFKTNKKEQIFISVQASNFENGQHRFIIAGVKADGSTEELPGSESFFTVKKDK